MNYSQYISKCELKTLLKVSRKEIINRKAVPLFEDEKKVYVLSNALNKESDSFFCNKYLKETEIIIESQEEVDLLIETLFYDKDVIENELVTLAIRDGASDIHFEPFEDEVIIRFRINGKLIIYLKIINEDYNMLLSRVKIQADMDITERKRPQNGKIKFKSTVYNCRLSTMPTLFGEKLVIRIMYNEKFDSDLEKLNFSERQLLNIKKIVGFSSGMVIINGPTGSGKSTTIYSILNKIKAEKINIITLEDPVEVTLKGVNQISINEKTGLTFCEVLKNCLRQDPDVIVIGEIRDEETAKIAIRAAITGHKVYSTIHAKSPREVYFRLKDMGIQEYLIKEAVKGIMSQRLINTLCNNCKKKYKTINYENREIILYKKCGCRLCRGNGYASRKMVSTVAHIDNNTREKMNELINDKNLLNNYEMLMNINELLIRGDIDYYDYINFIEEEELNEGQLREFIINNGESI